MTPSDTQYVLLGFAAGIVPMFAIAMWAIHDMKKKQLEKSK